MSPLVGGRLWEGLGQAEYADCRPTDQHAPAADLLRGIEFVDADFHLQERVAGNGKTTVAYIEWCQTLYPDKKLLFLWDGASYHRGADLKEFLTRENAGFPEADWKVTCMLFAPNAPEQNPTEDVWLKAKQYLRKHFAVNKTFAQVKRCFSEFLNSLSFTSAKLRWYWPEEQMI